MSSRNTHREMPCHTTFRQCVRLAILILFIVTWKPLPTVFAATNSNTLPAIQRCQELTAAAGSLYRLRSELEVRSQQQDALAEFCLSFMPDPRNAHAPFYWLQQSATHGLPDAQLLMGTAYETGMWTDTDPQQALTWFTRAAQQDFGPAQFELGAIYYEGRLGFKPDYQEALFWTTSPTTAKYQKPRNCELRLNERWYHRNVKSYANGFRHGTGLMPGANRKSGAFDS